jgi:hypothetical protein
MGEEKTSKCNFLFPRQQPISNHFSLKAMSFFKVEKKIFFSFLKRARLIIVA